MPATILKAHSLRYDGLQHLPYEEPDEDQPLDPEVVAAVLYVAVPTLGGIISAAAIKSEWYNSLKKPSWAPPTWVICPVWLLMYMLSGLAAYLVYKNGHGVVETAIPLFFYVVKLLLKWAWAPAFFTFKKIKWAFYDLLLVDVIFLVVAGLFFNTDDVAGYLLIPYFLWLVFATILNCFMLLPKYSNLSDDHMDDQIIDNNSSVDPFWNSETPTERCENCGQQMNNVFNVDRF